MDRYDRFRKLRAAISLKSVLPFDNRMKFQKKRQHAYKNDSSIINRIANHFPVQIFLTGWSGKTG